MDMKGPCGRRSDHAAGSGARPFDHPDWLFELKHDGFRALAHIEGHHCKLISRRGHTFKHWPYLEVELAHVVRCESAILDGEVVCLDEDAVLFGQA